MAYLDTSILAAYYCPEPLSTAVDKALKRVKAPAISPLVEVEFASALAMKVRRGELGGAVANKILAQFQIHLAAAHYELLPLPGREYALARDWLARFSTPLRALDALHLACAFSNTRTILTADKRLSQSARLLGVKCKLIS